MMTSKWGQRVACAVGLLLVLNAAAFAQGARRGEISGSIKDDTGATLPGVSVTVTSPALQVPQLVGVSDERGEYRVVDLPIGTFKVQYELAGFGTLVREGIVLTSGFAARVDVVLKVATLAETVTVSGESPVVDVTTTRGGATISKELLAAIPSNANFRDTMLMVGGMQANNAPMTGQVTAAAIGFTGVSYGAGLGEQVAEGMKRLTFAPANFSAYEEVDVKTFGNTADVDNSGAVVQMVVKSGGNQFHGRFNNQFQNDSLQSGNLDARLRSQGLNTSDSINFYDDFTGDLGGRIIRDKLWFYVNGRKTDNKWSPTGFVANAGPDGVFRTGDEPTAYARDRIRSGIVKLSWQPTAAHRFTGLFHDNNNHYYQYYGPFVPLESTARHNQLSRDIKPLDYQGTFGTRLLVSQMYGIARFSTYRIWNGPGGVKHPGEEGGWVTGSGVPSVLNRTTGQRTGPAWDPNVLGTSSNPSNQLRGNVQYSPERRVAGSHQFQVGYLAWWSDAFRAFPGGNSDVGCKYGKDFCPANMGIGEYELIFDNDAAGVPRGAESIIKNFPLTGVHNRKNYAIYGMDEWRMGNRVTVNAGLRWEQKKMRVPAQHKHPTIPAGFVQPVGEVFDSPAADVGDFKAWAPRVGAAWDLTGDGKTVAKFAYGKFNLDLDYDYGSNYSLNRPVEYNYRWHDINGDGKYQPGEIGLALNGPVCGTVPAAGCSDLISVAGVTNLTFNPDLTLPVTHEISTSLERQLGEGFAARGLFVWKRLVGGTQDATAFSTINIARPYSVYNRTFQRKDPGPDGNLNTSDDGPMYTIYDYDPAYRGAAFQQNMLVNNSSGRDDTYKSYEVMLTKRGNSRWYGNTSVLFTQNRVWRVKAVQSPNDENIFPVSNWSDLAYLAAGGYNFPHGFTVSTLFQAYTGLPRQRVVQFRATDPAGGPAFTSGATITLPMESVGAQRGPSRRVMNLRGGKSFRLPKNHQISLGVDAFNLFNTNVPWGAIRSQVGSGNAQIVDVSGPTYGNALAIIGPRVVRLGVTYEF
jgi:hypothetical protein